MVCIAFYGNIPQDEGRGKKYYAVISKNTYKPKTAPIKPLKINPAGHGQIAMPRRAKFFLSVVKYVVKADMSKISFKKSYKIQENRTKTSGFSPIIGGDYRTRICDLLRVKIRRNEN